LQEKLKELLMFGRRSDGKKIKTIDPIFKVIPCIMKTRNDSQVYFKQDIVLTPIEDYIARKADEGIKISMMDVFYAAIIRVIALRPHLNRFVINGQIYKRNDIMASLAIKKEMTDEGVETNIKNKFNGTENIFEVKKVLEDSIDLNKKMETENNTDSFVKILHHMPTWLVKGIVNFLWFLDNHGCMPKSVIDLSPFHTSFYLTNVGSLGIDSIYHHIYNFGTTSLFFSMGKKKKSYLYEDDEIKKEKCITLAFVGDERICDGFYYASSFKMLTKF
jgi:hypothetical protein